MKKSIKSYYILFLNLKFFIYYKLFITFNFELLFKQSYFNPAIC